MSNVDVALDEFLTRPMRLTGLHGPLLSCSQLLGLCRHVNPQLYYNPLVPMAMTRHRGRSMKYGVISMEHLKNDLADWTWLYAAGRCRSRLPRRGSDRFDVILTENHHIRKRLW